MTDISKVQGPSGPPEGPGKRDRSGADADKFKKEMQKVREVSQIDPDEQKKRKRREESEEEAEEQITRPPAPAAPESIPLFSLDKEKEKASPFDIQLHGPGTSPIQLKPSSRIETPDTAAFMRMPAPSELEDESGPLEQESFIETFPAEQAPPAFISQPQAPLVPPPQATPQLPPLQNLQKPTTEQPQQQPTSTSTPQQPVSPAQKPQTGAAEAPPPDAAPTEEIANGGTPKEKPLSAPLPGTPLPPMPKPPTAPGRKEGALSASQLENAPGQTKEETSALYQQIQAGAEGGGQEKKPTPEEIALQEALSVNAEEPTPSFPPATSEKKGGKEKDDIAADLSALDLGAAGAPMPLSEESSPPAPLSSYTTLSPQVMELFDRMVGVMTVMNVSGMSETTFTLNSPQFASSVFFGTQIIIQEFTSAPKEFNIQLKGSPQAVALFQGNSADLMSAFQSGNFGYRVNRLETALQEDQSQEEQPLFKRKEKTSGEQQEQSGDA